MGSRTAAAAAASAYLFAAAAANLLVAEFGPVAAVPVAFTLIGFDLIARDVLHELWQGRALWVRMAALIVGGAAVAAAASADAQQVALASAVAFLAAGATDALTYQAVHARPPLQRMNLSNVPAAMVDSLLFPTIAFGQWVPEVVVGQFTAKITGGVVWSMAALAVMRKAVRARGEDR